MAEQKISARYASSFLESSLQKNLLDTVSADIDFLSKVFSENLNLKNAIENPVIKAEVKSSILEEIFRDKIHPETMAFLLFIIKKNREDLMLSIIEKFKELRDIKLGYLNVNVISAAEFTEAQKAKLKDKLQEMFNKNLRITYNIDEKLLGGFVLKVGDTVFNASIKHQLELLRKHFMKANPISN